MNDRMLDYAIAWPEADARLVGFFARYAILIRA